MKFNKTHFMHEIVCESIKHDFNANASLFKKMSEVIKKKSDTNLEWKTGSAGKLTTQNTWMCKAIKVKTKMSIQPKCSDASLKDNKN